MTSSIRRALLLGASALIASCGGGGGGGAAAPNAAWVTDPSAYDEPAIPPVDTSRPHHVIAGTESQMIAGLQAALNDTSSGGIIVFDAASDVTLRLTQPFIVPYSASYETTPRPIVIDGKGRITLDGQNATRILQKQWRTDLTVQNLRFVNGRVGSDPGDGLAEESGAAINVENWDARLTVIHCAFTNCVCTEDGPDRGGGAIRAAGQRHVRISNCTFTGCSGSNGGAGMGGIGGAIYTDGVRQNADAPRFVLARCTFAGNTAGDHGGAVFNYTIPGTGSVSVVSRCTFENNTVPDSAAPYVGTSGAIYTQGADTSIVDSTFSGNFAQNAGGAISFHTDVPSRVANCTFSGNSVWFDEAAHDGNWGGAIAEYGAPLYISHCTFADNRAGIGAAIRNGSNLWLKSCVFGNNLGTKQWEGHAVRITALDGGGNVQWPATKSTWGTPEVPATATVVFADPLLGPLADNGGPTRTRVPGAGSPAIDAGSPSDFPPTDQRGQPRPTAGTPPDAGSVETP